MKKLNLLILGASGGVANALLQKLANFRHIFGKLILLDKNKSLLENKFINHKNLNYKFIRKKIVIPDKEGEYLQIIRKNRINIVMDLTDIDTIPIIQATNKTKASYVNTALNGMKKEVTEIAFFLLSKRNEINRAPHILCAGMNPGAVNLWVRYGIEKFSVPNEIVHFEYDTSRIKTDWKPAVTWSLREFITETSKDSTGFVLGRDRFRRLKPNGLRYRTDMKKIMKPIMKLKKYPEGFLVLHEENITLAQKYDVPSKFIYAVDVDTMNHVSEIYSKNKRVNIGDLNLADNTTCPLDGADNVGVMMDYDNKAVYYFNSISNDVVNGTNATYTQVIVGVVAALLSLVFHKDELKKGINFPEDLYNTPFRKFVFDNMRIQEFVFRKKNGQLKLRKYNPRVSIKGKGFDYRIC